MKNKKEVPAKETKTYRLPIVWQVMGYVEVEAQSLAEACRQVGEDDGNLFQFGLPDGEFLDESFGMDKEGVLEMAQKPEVAAIKKLPKDYWR